MKVLVSGILAVGLVAGGAAVAASANASPAHHRHHHRACHHVTYGVWAPARITWPSACHHAPKLHGTPIPRPTPTHTAMP